MRSIRTRALGVGVVSGVVFYAGIRIAMQLTPPWVALDVLAAFGGGLLLGLCYYLFCKLVLRRVALRFRAEVAPLVGNTLPPMRDDEIDELRQTYDRTVKALTRHDRYSTIADQIASSDDLAAAFRVIAENAARALPIDGAALFMRQGALLRAVSAWNMESAPLPETESETAVWRVLLQNRPLLLNHADDLASGAGLQALALIAAPLAVDDRPVGALVFVSRTSPTAFDDDHLALTRFFARQAAIAVRHARLADAARTAQNRLAALEQAAHDLGDNHDLDEVLRRVIAATTALTASSHATVLLLDESGERITYRIALDSGNIAPLELVAGPMMRQGLAGWVAREGRAVLIDDTEQDPRWLPGPGSGDLRSALVVPLLLAGRPLGILTLGHDQPDHYDQEHLRLLEALSAQAALAIENARLAGGHQPLERAVAASAPISTHRLEAGAQEAMVIYADLRGLAKAGERLTPERLVDEVLDVFAKTLAEVAQRYDGAVEQRSGDGFLAIFKCAEPRSNDALRAVQAALALRQASTRLRASWRARLGVDIGVAVGLGRGRVVGRVGAGDRPNYTAIGDAITLASRLQALARTGEILAAAEVVEELNGAGARFDVEALPPLPL
ncbi:MAG TPA: GAF domain-containing protein, partial [Roseiflexaceae bacterium]|nr:GAF domain-containing protein [Roseiflexaceae bacterium]